VWALNPDGTKQKPQPAGYPYWVEVTTTPDGYNDLVWATTLCQCFLLNLGESPFYANYGLPAEQAIIQQIAPDYNAQQLQRLFAQYFLLLTVVRNMTANPPTYDVYITTNQGLKLNASLPVPS
jgi:hypothetical protein